MMKLINCITILLVVVYTNAQPAGMMDEVEENVVRSLIMNNFQEDKLDKLAEDIASRVLIKAEKRKLNGVVKDPANDIMKCLKDCTGIRHGSQVCSPDGTKYDNGCVMEVFYCLTEQVMTSYVPC